MHARMKNPRPPTVASVQPRIRPAEIQALSDQVRHIRRGATLGTAVELGGHRAHVHGDQPCSAHNA